MEYRNVEGRCPLCGSSNLRYGEMELCDESIAYATSCRDCDASWLQWYSLVYCENTDVMDKDGKEYD